MQKFYDIQEIYYKGIPSCMGGVTHSQAPFQSKIHKEAQNETESLGHA